jgi:outer membrane lipoprotein-sorting protein
MAEFDNDESEFAQFLRELPFDDTPRPEHCDALRDQVLHRFDHARAAKTATRTFKHTFDSWRELMRRPVPRFSAVTILCLSIAAFWLIVPGHQSSAFAFNSFATALAEAKTARFQMEIRIEGQPNRKVQAYYLAPGRFRQEMTMFGAGSVSISDDVSGKMVMLMTATKTAMVMTSKGQPKDQPPNEPFFRLRELLSKNRDTKNDPFKPIGEKEINGKPATGFRSDSALGQFTLWGDPKTGNPVRVEAVWSGTPRTETVLSDFEINVDLNASMFDLTPPADYKVQSFDIDVSKPGELDLVNSFRVSATMSGGEFPDSLGLLGQLFFITKHTKERFKNPSYDEKQQLMKELALLTRGFRFALELSESADAHYAGKGVKQGAAGTPIFWYKPPGSMKFRVINADLTVQDADGAPRVSGAVRLNTTSQTSQPQKK